MCSNLNLNIADPRGITKTKARLTADVSTGDFAVHKQDKKYKITIISDDNYFKQLREKLIFTYQLNLEVK